MLPRQCKNPPVSWTVKPSMNSTMYWTHQWGNVNLRHSKKLSQKQRYDGVQNVTLLLYLKCIVFHSEWVSMLKARRERSVHSIHTDTAESSLCSEPWGPVNRSPRPVPDWWEPFQPQQWDISQRGLRLWATLPLASSTHSHLTKHSWLESSEISTATFAFRQTWSGCRIKGGNIVNVELPVSRSHELFFNLWKPLYLTFLFCG